MKIAIHQPRVSYYLGGGERIPLQQAEWFSKLGHKVVLVTRKVAKETGWFQRFKEKNVNIKIVYLDIDKFIPQYSCELENRIGWDWNLEALHFALKAREFYKENAYDLIAFHYTTDAIALLPTQQGVVHLHGVPSTKNEITNLCLSLCSNYIAVSEFVKNSWEELFNLGDIKVVYNGVDPDYWKNQQVVAKKFYDVLFVGRLLPNKGVDCLLKSLSLLQKRVGVNLKTAIVGDGPERNNLENIRRKLGLKSVWFKGRVTDSDLVSYYLASKIAVFPSWAKEGVLTTILEAAVCKTPVITSMACSMPEFVEDGKTGILFHPQDSKDLSTKIITLLENRKLRYHLAKNAYGLVIAKWTWEKRIKELEKVYLRLIRGI